MRGAVAQPIPKGSGRWGGELRCAERLVSGREGRRHHHYHHHRYQRQRAAAAQKMQVGMESCAAQGGTLLLAVAKDTTPRALAPRRAGRDAVEWIARVSPEGFPAHLGFRLHSCKSCLHVALCLHGLYYSCCVLSVFATYVWLNRLKTIQNQTISMEAVGNCIAASRPRSTNHSLGK